MCDCTDHKDEIPAYNAQVIESKWMKVWEDSNLFAVGTDASKPKKYVLENVPLSVGRPAHGPRAQLHHRRCHGPSGPYGAADDVLHPIGFDAFGLPAENAAIKHNTQAAAWTYKNMDQALVTIKRMGFSYDLDRMVKTCSPDYYRWGQWIFEKLWEKGLVYRKKNPVNWCPTLRPFWPTSRSPRVSAGAAAPSLRSATLSSGTSRSLSTPKSCSTIWRSSPAGPSASSRCRPTGSAGSEGAEVDFTLCDKDGEPIERRRGQEHRLHHASRHALRCLLLVLAPEYARLHELVEGTEYEEAVTKIVEDSKHISAGERAQVVPLRSDGAFTGRYVVNPVNGEKVPVWVADYVVADYGTGAVMAVPCGDQATLSLPVKSTCRSCRSSWTMTIALPSRPAVSHRYLPCRDRRLGLRSRCRGHARPVRQVHRYARRQALRGRLPSVADLEAMGCGRRKVEFRLRDWLISRQRYWGNPIPAIHCEHCGIVPVPEDQLPVTLPENLDLGAGETSPSARSSTRPPARSAAAGRTRDRYHGHLHLLQLVLPTLYRSAQHGTPSPERPPIVGCPSITTSAASSRSVCTCSTVASLPRPCATWAC